MRVNIVSNIAEIDIDKESKFNISLRNLLSSTLIELEKNKNIKVIVLNPNIFTLTTEIEELAKLEVSELLYWGENIWTPEILSKPVIAGLKGTVSGASFQLALACDIRIGSLSTKLILPEVKYGIVPGSGGITRLVKNLGMSRAFYYILLGKYISAREGYEFGIINELVDNDEEVTKRCLELAEEISKLPELAVKGLKKIIKRIADSPIDVGTEIEKKTFGLLSFSEDYKEIINKLFGKKNT